MTLTYWQLEIWLKSLVLVKPRARWWFLSRTLASDTSILRISNFIDHLLSVFDNFLEIFITHINLRFDIRTLEQARIQSDKSKNYQIFHWLMIINYHLAYLHHDYTCRSIAVPWSWIIHPMKKNLILHTMEFSMQKKRKKSKKKPA